MVDQHLRQLTASSARTATIHSNILQTCWLVDVSCAASLACLLFLLPTRMLLYSLGHSLTHACTASLIPLPLVHALSSCEFTHRGTIPLVAILLASTWCARSVAICCIVQALLPWQ